MASVFSGRAGRLAANAAQQEVGNAFNQAKTDLKTGYDTYNTNVGEGYDKAQGYYQQAGDLYKPIGQNAGYYADQYKAGLGNTPESQSTLGSMFTANPGYQFALQQGQQGLARQAAAGGRGASGNALMAAQQYGQGLANQEYNNWYNNYMNNLYRGQQGAMQGVQGQSQALDAQGRLAYGYGTDTGNTAMQYGRTLADMGTAYGDKAASISMSGIKAGDQAAANRYGAMMGGLNLLGSGLGALAGNPSAPGNIGANFGGFFKS
jgi:hypothetical protein